MCLSQLINNFSIGGFQDFISDKNSTFIEEIEEYYYEDDNFTEVKSIGKLEYEFFTLLQIFYIKLISNKFQIINYVK